MASRVRNGDSADARRRGSDRAVSPVVGKAMEASLVVLYIGVLTATLYGGVVPDYRTAAGAEVGERVLSKSAERVQQSVPSDAVTVSVRTRVTLPDSIRGRSYDVRAENGSLALVHPNERVGTTVELALPASVAGVSGEWSSREPAVVVVRSSPDGPVVELRRGDA